MVTSDCNTENVSLINIMSLHVPQTAALDASRGSVTPLVLSLFFCIHELSRAGTSIQTFEWLYMPYPASEWFCVGTLEKKLHTWKSWIKSKMADIAKKKKKTDLNTQQWSYKNTQVGPLSENIFMHSAILDFVQFLSASSTVLLSTIKKKYKKKHYQIPQPKYLNCGTFYNQLQIQAE